MFSFASAREELNSRRTGLNFHTEHIIDRTFPARRRLHYIIKVASDGFATGFCTELCVSKYCFNSFRREDII